ncbi:MAG: hypothetical protein SEPTF4163_005177 [Sporothrix epigloea]
MSPPRQSEEPDPFFRFQSRRSVVHSTRGIVSCTSPLAGQAGIAILSAGGNAADAAVAASAVLAVVDPSMTGIGGDTFALFFDANKGHEGGRVLGLNASGRVPKAATREIVCASLGLADADENKKAATTLPHDSVHAVTVPAGAAGWVDAVEQFGSGRVTLADVLAPAIRLAEQGFPVSKLSAHYWQAAERDLLLRTPPTPSIYKRKPHHTLLKPDPKSPHGIRAPHEGEIISNPDLAETLRLLATHGKAGFYQGPVAEAIVALSQAAGGLITLEDLEYHASLPPDIHEALSMPLGSIQAAKSAIGGTPLPARPLRLWEHPPNGQGIVALLAVGILEELERTGKIVPLQSMQHNSAEYIHAIVSALRIAFADAGWFVADPKRSSDMTEKGGPENESEVHVFDPKDLLKPEYLATRAALFDPKRAPQSLLLHGTPAKVVLDSIDSLVASKADEILPPMTTSDTVYLAVTDEEGNGCSFVNSVSDLFGSCLVVPGCGFCLSNRGHMFRLGPADHPNVFAGGKRAYNTIIPAILTADDNHGKHTLDTVFGVMGGYMQPQGHVQVLLNMHAFGMDPQTALDAPRVCVAPNYFWTPDRAAAASSPGEVPGQLYVEEGLPEAVISGLQSLGYTVVVVQRFARSLFGRGQVIRAAHDPVTGKRLYAAGSDGRGDGHSVPLI